MSRFFQSRNFDEIKNLLNCVHIFFFLKEKTRFPKLRKIYCTKWISNVSSQGVSHSDFEVVFIKCLALSCGVRGAYTRNYLYRMVMTKNGRAR